MRVLKRRMASAALGAAVSSGLAQAVLAHHSFAMYDVGETYVMTGIVTRVDPNPNHLQIFFAPLNEARDQVLKDDAGEPIVCSAAEGYSTFRRSGIDLIVADNVRVRRRAMAETQVAEEAMA